MYKDSRYMNLNEKKARKNKNIVDKSSDKGYSKRKTFLGFMWVKSGDSVVAQNLNGKLITKKNGLRFFAPWYPDPKVIHTAFDVQNISEFECSTKKGYSVSIDPSVTYSIVDLKLFYENEDSALDKLNEVIISLIRKECATLDYKDINGRHIETYKKEDGFDNKKDLEKYENVEYNYDALKDLRNKFGIHVDAINITKALPLGELKRALDENAAAEEQRTRDLENATNETAISVQKGRQKQIEADAEAYKFRKMQAACDTAEAHKDLRAKYASENPNATFIMSDGGNNMEEIAHAMIAASKSLEKNIKALAINGGMSKKVRHKIDKYGTPTNKKIKIEAKTKKTTGDKQIRMLFPLSTNNDYWDGKLHVINPKTLATINDTNYYYMDGYDNSYNTEMMTLLMKKDDKFFKIPLDNYDEFKELLSKVKLDYVSINQLTDNIGLLNMMSVDDLKKDLCVISQITSSNDTKLINNVKGNVFIQYPLSNDNEYFDGKIHETTPITLSQINDSDYYYFVGKDKLLNIQMMLLLKKQNGQFYKVSLDDYTAFNSLLKIAELKTFPTSELNKNIAFLGFMTIDELRSELGISKGSK